jgi:hypothetical protein
MDRAECIKNGGGIDGAVPVLARVLVVVGALLAAVAGAMVPRSREAQDPWDQLAWLADSLPGPAALFAGGRSAPRPSLWMGHQRPFNHPDLASRALAFTLPAGPGVLCAGLHQLDAPAWRERQAALELQAGLPGKARAGLGVEWRQAATTVWREEEWRLRGGVDWGAGPLRLAFHAQQPRPGGEARAERGLTAACHLSPVCWAGWSLVQEGSRGRERLVLGAMHGRVGLVLGWRPGLGWEAAGRADWKGLSLRVAWRAHPVLPPEQGWGVAWTGGGA